MDWAAWIGGFQSTKPQNRYNFRATAPAPLEKSVRPPKKNFFNSVGQTETSNAGRLASAYAPEADIRLGPWKGIKSASKVLRKIVMSQSRCWKISQSPDVSGLLLKRFIIDGINPNHG
jgi:hypothetical protein